MAEPVETRIPQGFRRRSPYRLTAAGAGRRRCVSEPANTTLGVVDIEANFKRFMGTREQTCATPRSTTASTTFSPTGTTHASLSLREGLRPVASSSASTSQAGACFALHRRCSGAVPSTWHRLSPSWPTTSPTDGASTWTGTTPRPSPRCARLRLPSGARYATHQMLKRRLKDTA